MIIVSIEKEELTKLIKDCVRSVLKEDSAPHKQEFQNTDRIFTIDEASDFLKISKSSLYKKVEAGIVPHCRPEKSKRLLFSEKDLIEFVKKGRQKTIKEIEESAEELIVNRRKIV